MSVTLFRTVGRYALVYGVALLILLPFLWVLLSAFKAESELMRYPPTIMPERWTVRELHRSSSTRPRSTWRCSTRA